MPPRHEEIGERGDHKQPVVVLLQPPVAHLGKAEDALDDQKGMLDLGPHLRLDPVLLALPLGQRLVTGALLIGEVLRLRRGLADQCFLAGIGRVAIDPVLVAMQQLRDRMLVMHVGRGRRVDDRRIDDGTGTDLEAIGLSRPIGGRPLPALG